MRCWESFADGISTTLFSLVGLFFLGIAYIYYTSTPDTSYLHVGDKVMVVNPTDNTPVKLYSICKDITIIGLKATNKGNVAWVFMDKCEGPKPIVDMLNLNTDIIDVTWLIKIVPKKEDK
jgi:hypothetical protein